METPVKRAKNVLELPGTAAEKGPLTPQNNQVNCNGQTSLRNIPSTPFLKKLGFGSCVQVLFMQRNNPPNAECSPWAIKMVSRRADLSNKQLYNKRLLVETDILKKLNHPNIVGYRAFATLESGQHCIALEYCNSSLGDILEMQHQNGKGQLESKKVLRMTEHVLRGLDYLHTVALILHGDMKSFNVLIHNDFEMAKICDFGVSLELKRNGFLDLERNPNAQYVGTDIWSAPEVLEEDPTLVSVKADIFSFGLTIYETIVLMPPHMFTGMEDESICNSTGTPLLEGKVDNVKILPRRIEFPNSIDDENDRMENKRRIDDCVGEMAKKFKPGKCSQDDVLSTSTTTASVPTPAHVPDFTAAKETEIVIDDCSLNYSGNSTLSDDSLEEEVEMGHGEDKERYEADKEDNEDEDEDEDHDPYSTCGMIGTRPPIPSNVVIEEGYHPLVEMFYVCTQADPGSRPTARQLLDALERIQVEDDPTNIQTGQSTEKEENTTELGQ